MTAEYKIRISNTSGVLQAELVDILTLAYIKRVNDVGLIQFSLAGDSPIVQSLADKWIVEVYKRDQAMGIGWMLEIAGFFREPEQFGDSPGTFYGVAQGLNAILSWRVVAWYAGTADRSEFIEEKAETVAKTLVDYNAASNATTGNGRHVSAAVTGLTVESDSAGGNTITHYCHGDNLLETLQEVAAIGGGDFDIVKTGAAAFQFRWYTGQLGTDRTATVLFSLARGNMANPYYKKEVLNEKTLAVVAGQGEGTDRDITTRQGDNYSAANHHEIFVDARNVKPGDTAGLADKGDAILESRKAEESFLFDVVQTDSSQLGVHYFLGDLVSILSPFSGTVITRKIISARTVVDEIGNTNVSLELANA